MITWGLIALGCGALLVGALAVLTVVVIRRRRQPEQPSVPAVAPLDAASIPTADSDMWGVPVRATGTDEGGVSLAGEPTTGISFESLIRRATEDDRPRLDHRELVAAQQQERILPEPGQRWRQTGRASVRRSTDGSDVLIFDRVVARRSAEDAFAGLVSRENDVRAGLGSATGKVDLAWPQEAVLRYDGGVTGYFMPGLDASYVLDVPGRGRAVRTLEAANGLIDADLQRLGSGDLLELVRTVASWLRAMHAAGVVFGDLGPRCLAYAIAPVRIRVLGYDTARAVGRGALLDSDPEVEHDPLEPAGESSYDSDRFLFAQLAFRLMVTGTNEGEIAPEVVPARLLGLDERHTSRLRHLWERAAGPRGRRPTMDEWVDALGER